MDIERDGFSIHLTDEAVKQLQKIMIEENLGETGGLRFSAIPGGCSGFEYDMEVSKGKEEGDRVIEVGDAQLFVDDFSAKLLNGVKMDYKSGISGSGFIFDNPNATGGCGCGTSFSV